jgi:hypothetical protein
MKDAHLELEAIFESYIKLSQRVCFGAVAQGHDS